VLCREQGSTLSSLASKEDRYNPNPLDGFGLFGIVKETGVDDEGLAEFYWESYPYTLYKDEEMVFYNDFFGGRKLGLSTWNPFSLYSGYKKMTKRLEEKNLSGNLKGEGLLQGGIIIFGKDGKPAYAYQEETGSDIPVDEFLSAISAVKNESKTPEL